MRCVSIAFDGTNAKNNQLKSPYVSCSQLVEDQLFVFGGKNATSDRFFNDLFYFDVRLNQWAQPPVSGNPPSPRAYADIAAADGKLFLYGGYDGRQQFGGMFAYHIHLGRWDKVRTSATPTTKSVKPLTCVCICLDRGLWRKTSDTNQPFGTKRVVWEAGVSSGRKVTFGVGLLGQMTAVGDHMIMFGGRKRSVRQNDSFLFDTKVCIGVYVYGAGAIV